MLPLLAWVETTANSENDKRPANENNLVRCKIENGDLDRVGFVIMYSIDSLGVQPLS